MGLISKLRQDPMIVVSWTEDSEDGAYDPSSVSVFPWADGVRMIVRHSGEEVGVVMGRDVARAVVDVMSKVLGNG